MPVPRLTIVLWLAFAIRVVLAVAVQHQCDTVWHRQDVIDGDADGYWRLAVHLTHGEPYAVYDPPRKCLRMPGFPLLIAVALWCGAGPLGVRLLLAAVGTACCGLVYRLGREWTDDSTARLAALFAALSPTLAGFSVMLLSETAFAATMLLSLIAGTLVIKRLQAAYDGPLVRRERLSIPPILSGPRRRTEGPSYGISTPTVRLITAGLGTGVAIGLACYFRPSWLLAAPIFAVACGLFGRQNPRQAVLVAITILLGTWLSLVPWGWRNQRETGHFVLTTLWMGPSLYDGLNPHATGDSEMGFFDQENLLQTHSEYEVDKIYRQRAWAWAFDHPRRSFELAGAKFVRYWKPWPNANFGATILALTILSALPVIVGLWGLWRHRDRWEILFLCGGPILYFCGLHLIFVSSLRYRLPAEYPLLIAAALVVNRRENSLPKTADQPT